MVTGDHREIKELEFLPKSVSHTGGRGFKSTPPTNNNKELRSQHNTKNTMVFQLIEGRIIFNGLLFRPMEIS